MKTMFAIALGLSLLSGMKGRADDLFRLSWHGTAYSRDAAGHIVTRAFTSTDFVNQVATDTGLNVTNLAFVYRPNRHDTVVVCTTNGWIHDILQMEYKYTDIVNATQTKIVRQAFLFDEYHDGALGSAQGIELLSLNPNGTIKTCSFSGTFQYSIDGVIYVGSFVTGLRVVDKSGQ